MVYFEQSYIQPAKILFKNKNRTEIVSEDSRYQEIVAQQPFPQPLTGVVAIIHKPPAILKSGAAQKTHQPGHPHLPKSFRPDLIWKRGC